MRLGCAAKIGIIIAVLLGLLSLSLVFPIPQPHVEPAPERLTGELFEIAGQPFYLTGTLLASWLTIAVLCGIYFLFWRKAELAPSAFQSALEWPLEWLYNLVADTVGRERAWKIFPVVSTIFLYVIMNAWLSLLPGFGSIGLGEWISAEEGFESAFFGHIHRDCFVVHAPILRGANTDINVPLMLALVSAVTWTYWGFKSHGLPYLEKFFRFSSLAAAFKARGFKGKIFGLFRGLLDIFVGILELISEIIRIVSFTFRLFGNMTAGEVMIFILAFLIPCAIPSVFYGLEMFFGFVQALIFGGLTLAFIAVAILPHKGE